MGTTGLFDKEGRKEEIKEQISEVETKFEKKVEAKSEKKVEVKSEKKVDNKPV